MQEHELNTIMDLHSNRQPLFVIRIFKINEEQNMKTKMFAIKNLATFNLVLSNN